MHTRHHGSEEAETEDPTAHWPAGHAERVSSRLNEGPCLTNQH